MYAGRVARYPLVSHGEYIDGTDRERKEGRTQDRCITLSARRGQPNNAATDRTYGMSKSKHTKLNM